MLQAFLDSRLGGNDEFCHDLRVSAKRRSPDVAPARCRVTPAANPTYPFDATCATDVTQMYFVGRVSAKHVTRRCSSWRDVGLRLRLTRPTNLTQHTSLSTLNWRTTLPCVTSVYFVGRVSAKRRSPDVAPARCRVTPAANPTYQFDATYVTFSTQLANNATVRNIRY